MWQWAPYVSLRAPHVSRPLSPSSLPLSPPPSSAMAPPAPPCRPSRPPPLPTAAACLPSARSAPATAGVGGGGWQAAAAWSRVRPWRLLLEGTADEVVAGDKARHEEDQRGETHQVTRSAGSERAGGELATTGRRRPWRHGGAKCALVKPAVNTTQRHVHELREDTTNTPTQSVGGYGGRG